MQGQRPSAPTRRITQPDQDRLVLNRPAGSLNFSRVQEQPDTGLQWLCF